ncbi:gamma-glutamylcyclotransferase family protein [Bowmanella yangjiangensis]|uniref:Gamma-glutamylcyclotransferase n=1 Tax=Bowmanella yangjiangensis TaxID=2811230 RepID=A0ABS3CSF5_9ALTE|nr:gamma-glutamylcyclotransferase family protein [Bowmanella yangjiangensis]MBN7819341.1 gamma-glutamylcyclotransferase [Bowmanella yangjiangensis]
MSCHILYFAYGSNMSQARLSARIPSATKLIAAELMGFVLAFNKPGIDGSAKGNLLRTGDPIDSVWGVVYQIDATALPLLDSIEGDGYIRRTVAVYLDDIRLEVQTYLATHIQPDLRPFTWYKNHVLTGAQEHQLPAEHIASIRKVRTIKDPSLLRHQAEMSLYRTSAPA